MKTRFSTAFEFWLELFVFYVTTISNRKKKRYWLGFYINFPSRVFVNFKRKYNHLYIKISRNVSRGGFVCFEFQIARGVCRTLSDVKFKIARIIFPFKPNRTSPLPYEKTNKMLLFTQKVHTHTTSDRCSMMKK